MLAFLQPAHMLLVIIFLDLHAILTEGTLSALIYLTVSFHEPVQGLLIYILFPLPIQFSVSERFSLKRNWTKGHNSKDLYNNIVCAMRVVKGAPVSVTR